VARPGSRDSRHMPTSKIDSAVVAAFTAQNPPQLHCRFGA
jgi:hypothetical protein